VNSPIGNAAPMSTQLIEYFPTQHEVLLQEWLCAPHVLEWWGPTTLANALDESDGGSCRIVVEDAVPVGFIRWHHLSREELDAAGLPEIAPGGIDIDVLIGSALHLGRGVGSRALLEAESLLRRSLAPRFLSLCADVRNERALRCYRRAGFGVVRSFWESGREYVFLRKSTEPVGQSTMADASIRHARREEDAPRPTPLAVTDDAQPLRRP
jgi:aminoglycoside 6'-N-acetyltransferase-1b